MSRHPDALARVNYVVNYIFDPCDAPITVLLETLWPALLKMVLSLYAVDAAQV